MNDEDTIDLKWGTLKGWRLENSLESFEAIQRYHDLGESVSVMMQADTIEQKNILCEAIDKLNGRVYNNWEGEYFPSKEDAKNYILNYRKK